MNYAHSVVKVVSAPNTIHKIIISHVILCWKMVGGKVRLNELPRQEGRLLAVGEV